MKKPQRKDELLRKDEKLKNKKFCELFVSRV